MRERDCATCIDRQKRLWGCNGNAEMPVTIMGETHMTCPRRPVLDDPELFREIFRAYRYFQKGILPVDGGYEQQPHKLMVVIEHLDVIISKCEDFKSQQEQRKMNRGAGQPTAQSIAHRK